MRQQLRFIDCHAHLHSSMDRMNLTLEEMHELVRKPTNDFTLEAVINVWCETAELRPNHPTHALLDAWPFVWGSFGLHPHEASNWNSDVELGLREGEGEARVLSYGCSRQEKKVLKHKRTKALGEAGLDYHYMKSPRDMQIAAFRRQCQIAVEVTVSSLSFGVVF